MISTQSKEILLNLSMKCPNSTFDAQGSRVIIVVVHVGGAVKKKIYVAVVEALGEKDRQDETPFTIKIGGKTSFGSQLFGFVKFSFPVMGLMPYYAETKIGGKTSLGPSYLVL
jgi:hypothetical protein